MLSSAKEADSAASKYLVAARHVYGLLDHAIRQPEKLVAYPDLINASGPPFPEPFHSGHLDPSQFLSLRQVMVPPSTESDSTLDIDSTTLLRTTQSEAAPFSLHGLCHTEVLDDVRRIVDADDIIDRVVFDLDALITHPPWPQEPQLSQSFLSNSDEFLLGKFDYEMGHLQFESRFESGNLRKVIQVRQNEYDLILSPDLNTRSHIQWFYFRVCNIDSMCRYRFNIINLEKPESQYNGGMSM
uniref:Pepdidase_M14_N domain-containing protein n=1 Tax=Mesocestoides corti TaxID=53468 RepID=A0A5K3EP15_MESCO